MIVIAVLIIATDGTAIITMGGRTITVGTVTRGTNAIITTAGTTTTKRTTAQHGRPAQA
jgi:hypothetical protein